KWRRHIALAGRRAAPGQSRAARIGRCANPALPERRGALCRHRRRLAQSGAMSTITADAAPAAPINRPMVLASVMLATVLVALDQTIANVALPHMAGSVSASQDQIAWVLTSYIVAGAICTPITGWLVARLGRKRLLLGAVLGFIAASALCGAAQNLVEIVLFRVIQGVFGAPLIPLSQMLILDIYSPKERGPAMAIWGVGAMVAPIVGPVRGGWLTEEVSWRWVVYI